MTCFHGSHDLVMFLLLCIVVFLQSPVPASAAGEDTEGDLFQLLSRKEMVQMAGYGEEKLSTVLVTGSVHCEAHDLHGKADQQIHAWPIPGASVAVNCHSHGSEWRGKSTVARGITDEYGDFMIDLPSYLHAIPNLEKICRVKVHQIPKNSQCQLAYVKRHKKLRLSTFGNGIRTYSA
ncbi:uncharacterized protein LOC129286779 [Prosopis cineraria]|uniref:uncharacterized protein LOC129286779 n=1 Tax=Prosopis cineraria TaxID=364024 RepID=UPI0024109028|nr:uncharacterized protein LOC129286779 [Prosopis cineraria]